MSFHKLMNRFTFLCFSNREQISRKKIMWVWIRVFTWKGWRIWGRHHYWWRAANFDLYSELRAIVQWGFLSVTHLILHGKYVYVVISEDMWHSHPLPSGVVTTYLDNKSVATMIRTTNFRIRDDALSRVNIRTAIHPNAIFDIVLHRTFG